MRVLRQNSFSGQTSQFQAEFLTFWERDVRRKGGQVIVRELQQDQHLSDRERARASKLAQRERASERERASAREGESEHASARDKQRGSEHLSART